MHSFLYKIIFYSILISILRTHLKKMGAGEKQKVNWTNICFVGSYSIGYFCQPTFQFLD
jgi:hypothetical protein